MDEKYFSPLYLNNYYNSDAPKYSSFNATYFHTAPTRFIGSTTRLGISPGNNPNNQYSIYPGAPAQSYQWIAVNHQAFLFVPISGIYTFTFPYSDEISLLWIGDRARSTWARANAQLEQDFVSSGGVTVQYKIALTAGSYTPIRILWANAQGDFNFAVQVTAPDGTNIINGAGSTNGYLVQYTCDGSVARFPDFAVPTADQTCNNAGLAYGIYTNPYTNNDAPKFSSFNATYFSTAKSTYKGITTRVGIAPGHNAATPYSIYPGAPSQLYQFVTVNHQSLLFAPFTGVYSFSVPTSDEITLIWTGTKALSGWTRANADLEQDFIGSGGTPKVFNITLTAGTYTPFRILWANAQGDFNFIAQVTAPGGLVIVNGTGSTNGYLVQYDCDPTTPRFPALT